MNMKHSSVPRTPTFPNRGSSSSWSGETNASVSVGTMLKNSRLMLHSTHIGVYLFHAISCRWRTTETYFPTISHIKSLCNNHFSEVALHLTYLITCVSTLCFAKSSLTII
jgi:hypothetical protein